MKKLIGSGYIAPSQFGMFHNNKEAIPWSAKDADKLVLMHLSDFFQENTNIITQVGKVDLSIAIDHGKCYSRATLTVIH